MRVLICAGGSGGGVYPALSVWQALAGESVQVLWVGGRGGMEEELVRRAGVPFTPIPAAGVHGVGLGALPGNLWRLARGYLASRRVIREFRPQVLFFTGGYVAVPVALAARRLPILLYVPDIEPGLALKTLARFARQIDLIAEDSRRFFRRHAHLSVTGHPVRRELLSWNREKALDWLELDPEAHTLLVFGGSKGARSLNRALLAVLETLLDVTQIVHITGRLDWPEVQAAQNRLSPKQAARYRPFPYLHEEMGAAYAAADLVISRAGASAIGEFPLFGLPAILVPYPHAWRYQMVNADYLRKHGGALVIEDADLPARLLPTVRQLLDNPVQREQMRRAMASLARPQAAKTIAAHLTQLASNHHRGRHP